MTGTRAYSFTADVAPHGVLETARRLNVTLIAYSPLASGLLTGAFHDDPARVAALPGMRRCLLRIDDRRLARTARIVDELRAIGRAHGATAAQVALSWLITAYGDTVVAIPGASNPRQAEQNAAAMGLRLSSTEVARLSDLPQR